MSVQMTNFRPLWEADTEGDFLRRVIMAGYYPEAGQLYARVGEARWSCPDEGHYRWVWADGGDVINPLGFLEFPDFPIAKANTRFVVGREVASQER